MDRRRFLLTSLAGTVGAPRAVGAQPGGKMFRVGVLGDEPLETYAKRRPGMRALADAFITGLRDHGWIENENFTFVRRYVEGKLQKYPHAAAELVALRPDVIITSLGEPAVEALRNITTTIPIVMMVSADPVATGLVASLARPGGNVTGMSILAPETGGKRLQILKDTVPHVSRLSVLWNASYPGKAAELRQTEAAALHLKLIVRSVEVRGANDFSNAFALITSNRTEALITFSDPLTLSHLGQIVRYAAQQRLPLISEIREFADAGALLTYGANLGDLFRRAAGHVDRILKGAKPADLPVEQPTKFELVINLKTAKALGLTIPPSLLARADQVIE